MRNRLPSNRPDDLLPGSDIARAVTADLDGLHTTRGKLDTWVRDIDTFYRNQTPVEQDVYTADDVHQMAADGEITAYPEGGYPGNPRRVLFSLSEVRDLIAHTSRLPRDDEGQADEQPEPQLAELQLVQHRTGVTVHDLIAGIRRGILTDHSTPKVMIQDGREVHVPTTPLVDIDEVKRLRGELTA